MAVKRQQCEDGQCTSQRPSPASTPDPSAHGERMEKACACVHTLSRLQRFSKRRRLELGVPVRYVPRTLRSKRRRSRFFRLLRPPPPSHEESDVTHSRPSEKRRQSHENNRMYLESMPPTAFLIGFLYSTKATPDAECVDCGRSNQRTTDNGGNIERVLAFASASDERFAPTRSINDQPTYYLTTFSRLTNVSRGLNN